MGLEQGTELHEAVGRDALKLISGDVHALLMPYPAQGHINPMMLLGKRLVSQPGVLVTVAVTEHIHDKLKRAKAADGARHIPSDDANFQLVGIKDGLPPDFDRENEIWTDQIKKAFDEGLTNSAADLVETFAAQGRPVTCIVGDFFLTLTCSVAEKTGVPEYVFWPQCASVFSIYMHVDAIIAAGYNPFEANVRASSSREVPMELITCIPGLPVGIHPADLPFEGGPFGQAGVNWMRGWLRDRFGCMSKAHGVIGNSFQALEADMFGALSDEFKQGMPHPSCWPRSSLRLVGPLVPGAAMGEDDAAADKGGGGSLWVEEAEECKRWLDEQASGSVLFVAFGTTVTLSVRQAQELAFGLVASGQKFLWVIRERAVMAAEVEFWSGKEGRVGLEEALPAGFLEENRELCKVVGWAPQAQVLAHSAVGGFFTHCGWNSTLEALCCGVPILGWPSLADQVTNCWLASHLWKVGLTLERDPQNRASRRQVESGVRELMQGPLAASLRAKAREIKGLARHSYQRADGLHSFLQDVQTHP